MEDQNTSGSIETLPQKRWIIFRGIMWGTVGGVVVGFMFGLIYGLVDTFSYVFRLSLQETWESQYLVRLIFNYVLAMIISGVIWTGLPIGFVTGLSTGILATAFGDRCPDLIMWLVLSWIGVITSFVLGLLPIFGWLSFAILLGISLISFAASWMAYRSTIQKIKKGVPPQASSVLCSLSHVLLIFIILCPFFFLTNVST